MSREILFRGKRPDNGEWLQGYLIATQCWGNNSNYRYYIVAEIKTKTKTYIDRFEVIPETVGQFTGLTDKNGKKIFEGDIVKTKEFGKDSGNGVNFNNFDIFEVIYSSASFKLNNSLRLFNMIKGQEFEVIGNIHDQDIGEI